jgi:hypothetical protein
MASPTIIINPSHRTNVDNRRRTGAKELIVEMITFFTIADSVHWSRRKPVERQPVIVLFISQFPFNIHLPRLPKTGRTFPSLIYLTGD